MNSICVSHMLLISVSFKQISEFHFHHKIIFDINIFKQKLVESMICIIYHEFISQQVGLDGVRVAGLTQNLQQGGVRHEEESGEDQTLLLQVSSQRLLTDL